MDMLEKGFQQDIGHACAMRAENEMKMNKILCVGVWSYQRMKRMGGSKNSE